MDKSLWKEVIKSVKPLKKKNHTSDIYEFSESSVSEELEVSFISFPFVKKKIRKKQFLDPLAIADEKRINPGIAKKIRKGEYIIDAVLDLHGKTLDDAFNLFISFINKNYNLGNRCLLVITGKGNPSKNTGVIKKNFPVWVSSEFINDKILYVNTASLKDGGDGAFYILLRKK